LDDIVLCGLNTIKTRVDGIECKLDGEETYYFNPSRTAQNGINFITRELIEELKSSDDEAIRSLFELLCVLSGEEYNKPDLISHFFESLVTKNLTLGEFLLRKLHMRINFSITRGQIAEFKRIVDSCEVIFNQQEILKRCKPASYMIYYLKEVNEYVGKISQQDVERINSHKKLRRELQHLSKDEDNYSKYI
jgi:hypothetical protein